VVMSISTKASKASSKAPVQHLPMPYALWLMLPGIVIGAGRWGSRSAKRKLGLVIVVAAMILMMLSFVSCAGVSNNGVTTPPPNPVTYQVTVTGTSSGTPPEAGQSVVVTLVVD